MLRKRQASSDRWDHDGQGSSTLSQYRYTVRCSTSYVYDPRALDRDYFVLPHPPQLTNWPRKRVRKSTRGHCCLMLGKADRVEERLTQSLKVHTRPPPSPLLSSSSIRRQESPIDTFTSIVSRSIPGASVVLIPYPAVILIAALVL